MVAGVDALFLVVLCGLGSWLLRRQRRQDRHRRLQGRRGQRVFDLRAAPRALGAHRPGDGGAADGRDLAALLQVGAVVARGREDWVVSGTDRLGSGAPFRILCHLDGGTPGQVGLLAVPVGDLAADGGDETIWILRGERPGAASNRASLPPGVTRMDVLASPAAPVRVRNGIEYALTTRWRQAALSSAASDSGRLVVAYRGPGDRCLLELREGQSAIEYVGEILRHSDLEILPSATPLRRR